RVTIVATALDDIPARPPTMTPDKLYIRQEKEGPMSITPARKAEVIKSYATKSGDTGSPEVQVAVLSERITNLTEHFKSHVKDNHSRRGMIRMVSERRSLLDYVKKTDVKRYEALIARLGLRR